MSAVAMPTPVVDDAATLVETPARGRDRTFAGGWRIVAAKELGDHLRSVRFAILLVLMALAGLAAVHSASGPIRDAAEAASGTPSIFLYLFTISPERVPAFDQLIGIIGPLLGIAFGFDAINAERAQRTLPRLVAQPIHRDEILGGKFVAGVAAISLAIVGVVTVVAAYGSLMLGIVPSGSDIVRLGAFTTVAIVYVAFWLALSMLLSVVTRRAATTALAAIALWLVTTLFAGLIAGVVADIVHHVPADATNEQVIANARLELKLRRLSPDQLYEEATDLLLNPSRHTTGLVTTAPDELALPSSLPIDQSLRLAWWQVVGLTAGAVVAFAAAYVAFMRQEVRA